MALMRANWLLEQWKKSVGGGKQMKNRGHFNGYQQKTGKIKLLLWLNIKANWVEEAISKRCIAFVVICATIWKWDVPEQNSKVSFFEPSALRKSDRTEESFQKKKIHIFSIHSTQKSSCIWSCTQTALGKKYGTTPSLHYWWPHWIIKAFYTKHANYFPANIIWNNYWGAVQSFAEFYWEALGFTQWCATLINCTKLTEDWIQADGSKGKNHSFSIGKFDISGKKIQ